MKRLYLIVFIFIVAAYSNELLAQGCVAVRQMGGINPLSTNGYTLPKGELQIGGNYRYFHSWRHFVGKEEQPERQTHGGGFDANGKELGNAVNIFSHAFDLNLSYGISDRLQLNIAIPYVHNERSQVLTTTNGDKMRYSVYAQGLGDIRVSAGYWVFNPQTAMRGNLMAGLGIKTNSGSHSKMDNAPQPDGSTKSVMMDQAIQPGDGGVGVSVEIQGFAQLYKGFYGFVSGYYLFNPRESNGSYKSDPTVVRDKNKNVLGTLTGYNVYASPDQYFTRAGVMTGIGRTKNVMLSLAGRFEGIPAYDVFGGQVAYRRPGYVVAVEGGISVRRNQHSFGLFVPYNFIKNRIQSAADKASQDLQNSVITDESQKVHVQGDAAFADYSINLNYTYRFGKLFNKKAPGGFQLSPDAQN